MGKYIEVGKAMELCDAFYFTEKTCSVEWLFKNAPSIDIVFCKECRHRIDDDDFQEGHICLKRRANGGKYCRDNDFCSYGKRKELGENNETDY